MLNLYLHTESNVGTDKPTIKLLKKYVIWEIAHQWRILGMELLGDMSIIKRSSSVGPEIGCSDMLQQWLIVDNTASWNKLISALEKIKQDELARKLKNEMIKGMY